MRGKHRMMNYMNMSMIKNRWIIAFLVIVMLFTVLVFRLGYIQVIATEEYGARAAEAQTKDALIAPHRGRILDRNMKELAVSTDSYRIYLRLQPYNSERNDLEKWEKQRPIAIDLLAKTLGLEKKKIEDRTNTEDFRIRIAVDVTKAEAEKLQEGIEKDKLTILELERDTTRHYPMGAFASHVIGSVNMDGYGNMGIEYQYDSILRGQKGRSIAQTDSYGNPLSSGDELLYSQQDGLNVVLTIDENVQYFVERIVAETYDRTEPDRVQAIVLDPKTGDVLAMSNYPEFDPNNAYEPIGLSAEKAEEYGKLSDEEKATYISKNIWRNSAVSDTYEPGSVFKLLTASIALETGVSVPDDPIYFCDSAIQVEDRKIQCHIYPDGHGQQTLKQGVANSCNPTMVEAAQAIGYGRYYQYLELFGVTEATGIDLPGEASPLVYDPPVKEGQVLSAEEEENLNRAGPVEAATMAFGQGINVTPIEMVSAVSAIGNDGMLMQPRLVKGYCDDEGKMVETFDPVIRRQVLSKQTANEMLEIMEYQKYGFLSDFTGYRVGSKTGTAELLENGVYTNGIIGSVVSLAPIEDPKFAVIVIVTNPKNGTVGEDTAGPAVKQILEELMRYYNIKPQVTASGSPDEGSNEPVTAPEATNEAPEEQIVPDVTGMTIDSAIEVLSSVGMYYMEESDVHIGEAIVREQYPAGGSRVPVGGTVYLYADT